MGRSFSTRLKAKYSPILLAQKKRYGNEKKYRGFLKNSEHIEDLLKV